MAEEIPKISRQRGPENGAATGLLSSVGLVNFAGLHFFSTAFRQLQGPDPFADRILNLILPMELR